MENDFCHDVLKAEGFKPLAEINHDFNITLWWHPDLHQELSLVYLSQWVLIRGTKHYRLTSRYDSELYARELKMFDDYLCSHFEELHLSLSTFPYISPNMASRKISDMHYRFMSGDTVGPEELSKRLKELSEKISGLETSLRRDEDLFKLNHNKAGLLHNYIQSQIIQKRRQLEKLRIEKRTINKKLITHEHLKRQYLKKGQGTALLFTTCSNIQVIKNEVEFLDAIHSIMRQLENIEKFELKQKLMGGKLRIYIEPINQPAISLATLWVRAVLDPRQLANLGPDYSNLCKAVEDHIAVFPREDILSEGAAKDERKLVSARAVKNLVERLKVVPTAPAESVLNRKSDMPVWIGNTLDAATRTDTPWELPLGKMGHVYISGTTGAGKTFLAFVIVEGALVYRNLAIVVLTPNNQWAGLLSPEDRSEILERYKESGLKPEQARSFNFKYHGIAQDIGEPLPKDLRQLATGWHIISFKDSDDRTRCETTAEVLKSLFDACNSSESSRPRIIVIIDEAPRFTRKHVDREAQSAAAESEKAINLTTAEGRKYGLSVIILSQTLRHFSYDLAAVRQNIATRIFMRNSDGEIDHASQFMDDGREIVRLRTGEAILCNSEWGTVKVSIRPPFSKVWEPTDAEVKELVGSVSKTQPTLSREAQAVLNMASERYIQTGESAKLAFIAEQLGITSRRKIGRIINELKKASAVKFERLDEQGKPLVIIPIGVQKPRTSRA